VLTHEHSDHVGGVRALLRHSGCRSIAPAHGAGGLARDDLQGGGRRRDRRHRRAPADAVPVAHDAAEPLQYVFGDGERRLGVLTDVGAPGEDVINALAGVEALLLECNHDVGMLRASAYPPFLKARILGDHGHLSNAQAASLLGRLDRRRSAGRRRPPEPAQQPAASRPAALADVLAALRRTCWWPTRTAGWPGSAADAGPPARRKKGRTGRPFAAAKRAAPDQPNYFLGVTASLISVATSARPPRAGQGPA